jgi:hypothetical protein
VITILLVVSLIALFSNLSALFWFYRYQDSQGEMRELESGLKNWKHASEQDKRERDKLLNNIVELNKQITNLGGLRGRLIHGLRELLEQQ